MAFDLSLTGVLCKSQQLLSGPSTPFSTLMHLVSPSFQPLPFSSMSFPLPHIP